jgi:O-antigen/teichoic acid export membrane protein
MTRSVQFVRGLGSSWLATLASVLYSIVSVPIALRYLTPEEFGLFVLLLQVAMYFTLIEIGMSAAIARILIDYKDNPNGGAYGATILTGFCFFGVQALVVVTVGIMGIPWLVAVIGVPADYTDVSTLLLRWLAFTSALTLISRVYGAVLYANKRLDLIHAFTGIGVLFSLVVLACILGYGGGLAGLRWLFLAQAAVAILLPVVACYTLGLLPCKGGWGAPSIAQFRELFAFGKDIFLFNVGNQVLEASQLIIVTRTMGLPAAAIWSVSTKLFMLVYQLVTRLEGTAIVFFAEMMVRGETDKLAARFKQIYQISAGVAVVALAVVVALNKPFVSVWTNSDLAWSVHLSALMGLTVLLNVLTRCFTDLIIHTKHLGAFRFVYFAEAIGFVGLALSLSTRFGFHGILISSLACLIIFRVTYTTWRMVHYFDLPVSTFWWGWLRRSVAATLILTPFVLSAGYLASSLTDPWLKLLIIGAWSGIPAAATLFFVALPHDIRSEIGLRWQRFALARKL